MYNNFTVMKHDPIVTVGELRCRVSRLPTLEAVQWGLRLKRLLGSGLSAFMADTTGNRQGKGFAAFACPDMADGVSLAFCSGFPHRDGELLAMLRDALGRCTQLGAEEQDMQRSPALVSLTPEQSFRLGRQACRELAREFFLGVSWLNAELNSLKEEISGKSPAEGAGRLATCAHSGEDQSPLSIPENLEFAAFMDSIVRHGGISYVQCKALGLDQFFQVCLSVLGANLSQLQSRGATP